MIENQSGDSATSGKEVGHEATYIGSFESIKNQKREGGRERERERDYQCCNVELNNDNTITKLRRF